MDGGGATKTRKSKVIETPSQNDAPKQSEVKDGAEDVTQPSLLVGKTKEERPEGKLIGEPLSKKRGYELVYTREKCGGPKGTGDLVFKAT